MDSLQEVMDSTVQIAEVAEIVQTEFIPDRSTAHMIDVLLHRFQGGGGDTNKYARRYGLARHWFSPFPACFGDLTIISLAGKRQQLAILGLCQAFVSWVL